jgi:hypothetical protein
MLAVIGPTRARVGATRALIDQRRDARIDARARQRGVARNRRRRGSRSFKGVISDRFAVRLRTAAVARRGNAYPAATAPMFRRGSRRKITQVA